MEEISICTLEKYDTTGTTFTHQEACETYKTASVAIKCIEYVNMSLKKGSRTDGRDRTKILHATMILTTCVPTAILMGDGAINLSSIPIKIVGGKRKAGMASKITRLKPN